MSFVPVFAPYATTYAVHEPYVTVDEFTASPTGVDISHLASGGSQATQANAIAATLNRASSWADQICNQTLAATIETALGTYRVQDGVFKVIAPYSPVIQVNSYTSGRDANNLAAPTDLSGVTIEQKVITIPAGGLCVNGYVTVEYVAGFANMLLRTDSAVGDSTVTVDNTLGVAPGMPLQINDPMTGADEVGFVLSTTTTTITFTAPLTYAHLVGVNVSAMPAAIKQAVINLTASLIRGRATQAMTIQRIGSAPTQIQGVDPLVKKFTDAAIGLLQPFAAVVA